MKAIVDFYKSKRTVMAKIQFCQDDWTPKPVYGYRVQRSWTRKIHGESGMIHCPAHIVEDFLLINGVNTQKWMTAKQVKDTNNWSARFTNPESLCWYGFTTYSGKEYRALTLKKGSSFLKQWADHDHPDLYKYETNCAKNLYNAMIGCPYAFFTTTLVSVYDGTVQLDEDITDEEIQAIKAANRPDSLIGKAISDLETVRAMDEEQIAELEQSVAKAEQTFTDVVKKHWEEIKAREKECITPDDSFKFDCGFVFFYPCPGSILEANIRKLFVAKKRSSLYLQLNIPMCSQSVSVQAVGAELAQKLIEKECGQTIRFETRLD